MTKEPYGLDPNFEALVLWKCATDPRFWSRLGHALDVARLEAPEALLIIPAITQIAKETGSGPDSATLVVQRLRRRVNEGKLVLSELLAIGAFFDRVEDEIIGAQAPSTELVINELAPVVRRVLQSEAVVLSCDEYAKRGDFTAVSDLIEKAARVGASEMIGGVQLNAAAFDVIEKRTLAAKLPTGVMELDLPLDQGMPRAQLGVVVADSGSGKSMLLAHLAAEGVRRQLFTGFATLELPEAVQLGRIFANLTGVPVNTILDNQPGRNEARRRITIMQPHIGICEVAEFAPHATTVRDMSEWIAQKEHAHGRKMDLLVVDYADKLYEPRVKADNDYLAMRYVYEALRRDIAVARDMWVWTAAQASRTSKESAKRIDMHHISDSLHKIRVADLVLTVNVIPDSEQVKIFVAKNRTGKSRFEVGPLTTDFATARFVPLMAEFMPW